MCPSSRAAAGARTIFVSFFPSCIKRETSMGPRRGVQRTMISKLLCYVYRSYVVLQHRRFMEARRNNLA